MSAINLRPLPEQDAAGGAPGDSWVPASVADVVERMRLPGGGHCQRPTWLQPFVDILDRAVLLGDVYATASAPPQHSKSTVMSAALLFAALVRPGRRHIYSSYAQSRGDEAAKEVEAAALDLGLDPHRVGNVIELRGGTTILFTSVEGSVTGKPCDGLALLDDVVKGADESRSPTIQRKVERWYQMDLLSRLHPPSADGQRQGASVVVVMTRWTPEDLIGTLQRASRGDASWTHIRIPCLADDLDAPEQAGRELGAVLWPAERPLAAMMKRKGQIGARAWSAQYQGVPVPEGDRVLGNPTRYADGALPKTGRRWGYGLDTAGSIKQHADFNCLVQGALVDGVLYVTDFRMNREELTTWVPKVASVVQRQHAAVVLFGSGAGDNVACQLFARENVHVRNIPTGHEDKLVRARKYGLIERWAAGQIQFPEDRRWQDVLDQCMNFDGLGTGHDDFVDALVGLVVAVGLPPIGGGAGGAPFFTKQRGLYRDPRFPSDHRGDRNRGEVLFDASDPNRH